MTRYLLDTHTAIWFFKGNPALSPTAKHIIYDASISKYMSIVSAWEVAIKINIGKLDFTRGVEGFLLSAQHHRIGVLPITNEHLACFETLPIIHRDPFDRMLVATSIIENLTMITDDYNIAKYDVSIVW